MSVFSPEHWLETTYRCLKDYVEANINTRIYQVIMQFPAPQISSMKMPPRKTIIHFEADDIADRVVGMGENYFALNYDDATKTINPQEAREVRISFDVGVWSSDASGGLTARMRARQTLTLLFGGMMGRDRLQAATDGGDGYLEIVSFSGGRFVMDMQNDFRLYRMVDCSLEIRLFSRTPMLPTGGPTIEEILQDPTFWINAEDGLESVQ
jgi:hypothetical protein